MRAPKKQVKMGKQREERKFERGLVMNWSIFPGRRQVSDAQINWSFETSFIAGHIGNIVGKLGWKKVFRVYSRVGW